MSLTVTTTPNRTIDTFDSYTASTAQLRYVLTESSMAGKTDYYVKIIITELSSLTLYYVMPSTGVLTIDLGKAIQQAMDVAGVTFVYYRINCTAFYSSTSDAAINSDYTLAVKSRMQILSEYGSNMYTLSLIHI